MDNELEAFMYFRFLLRINNYKEPTHPYAKRMSLIMIAQKYNSSDDEIFRNKIEHYKKIDNIKAVDVLGKLEKLCVNSPIYKIPIILGVPEYKVIRILESTFPNYDFNARLTINQFIILKPKIAIYIWKIIKDLPEKTTVKFKKIDQKRSSGYKQYEIIENHKGLFRLIYTKM